MEKERINLDFIRERLARRQGKEYWRSLGELADTQEFQEFLQQEFPAGASEWHDGVSRRTFIKLMGASMALAGMTACTGPSDEKIVPYARAPEDVIPGVPLFYATAMPQNGYGLGVLIETHEGRPTKIEGNPDHPASLGATDVFAQASILTLYDPDRSQQVLQKGTASSWDDFVAALDAALAPLNEGKGLRILTETVTSPTLSAQMETLLARYPQARWHQYEAAGRDSVRLGARMAFGEDVNVIYRLEQAKVILSLDADFLTSGPGHLRYAREFMQARRVAQLEGGHDLEMNRLYAVESTPTNTGTVADHRLSLKASEVERFARSVAQKLGLAVQGGDPAAYGIWLEALVEDLKANKGKCLVIPGEQQTPVVQALAHAIMGNFGTTVMITEPVETNPMDQVDSLRSLSNDMAAGEVQALIILGGNPAFTAPADIAFGEQLAQIPFSVHHGLYANETGQACTWHIPARHYLESWGDIRAFDGTITIMQPLISPLYPASKSEHEVLAALLGEADSSNHEIVRTYWQEQAQVADFELFWRQSLNDGLIKDTAAAPRTVSVQLDAFATPSNEPASGLELIFRPDPHIWDGRYANNGWLQELPKSLTKLTWDNAALMSPSTAEQLGVTNEDRVKLQVGDASVMAPVWIMPGHVPDAVTIHLGYGRTAAGRVGDGVGFNAYALRPADSPWFVAGLQVHKTGEQYPLAITQEHHAMEGRELVRSGTISEFIDNPGFVHDVEHYEKMRLYPQHSYKGYAWGMAIDLSACIGCNACVVACQAENNIPIVGKDQVRKTREMHWIRIDRYYEGDLDNPEVLYQPVMCQHCEGAPCEIVCPAAATVHSREGLNDMIYNRCIGTRYCENNCPYKVRRFNFFQYVDTKTPTLKLMRNPNVTVRSRGVMEKCTFCVQRINAARITAKKEGRKIRDKEIQMACQAACPTQAIIFGNIKDTESEVMHLKDSPLNYELLGELNIEPRTTYLARLKNPNPKLAEV
ncbi:MAG: TAT-variant-translocated molybdopterin oxidoreductase [Chloroflexi bacterium]|nr:TAT-variant-translocated molybdopterin oxidoreductase [Chloroflexota bacterium]